MSTATVADYTTWAEEVRRLAAARRAVILAHNYQVPWIQDVADHVGDSLALSRAAAASDAEVIVFCGVHFMAETIPAEQLRAWKAEHPGAVVVAYVNTSAAVKAEADVCCTSSNAAEVVASVPAGHEILFLPDFFLGQHVRRVTGREGIHVWMGECHVHAGIRPEALRAKLAAEPDAELLVHPECGCTTSALWMVSDGQLPAERARVVSTGAMVDAARRTRSRTVLVATEVGILHQLRKVNQGTAFEPVSADAVCRFMKMITPAKLLASLRDGVHEVQVDEDVRRRAERAVQR